MQMDESRRLRKAWGGKECSDHNFEKEYYLGTATGDEVCTVCGYELTISEQREKGKDKPNA